MPAFLALLAPLALAPPAPQDEPPPAPAPAEAQAAEAAPPPAAGPVGAASVAAVSGVLGLGLTAPEIELMLQDVGENLRSFERLRALPLENSLPPALRFVPGAPPPAAQPFRSVAALPLPEPPERPADLEELVFADIPTLAALIRARRVSCVELARTYLARLERMDPTLHCVITLTAERALAQARALDEELERGEWRGPLHGIPWGAKDLLAVRGHPTTWGAAPYRDQVLDLDAGVVQRLDEAGAVLIAKLSLGALAWGDVWYGERTRNPWKPEQGSSGSSAGSASATAAGCVAFAIGSETLGSIVSPSDRCGASALRPTFGRVGRHGAMALSWSMDKLGPICRSATDAAIVFAAIQGPDARDPESLAVPFSFPEPEPAPGERRTWTIGYLEGAFEESPDHAHVLEELAALARDDLAIDLVPVELPDFPVDAMTIVLNAEAAAAFDDFSRAGLDDRLVRQVRRAWPNVFRASQLIPAVDYIRANRLRTRLIRETEALLSELDVLVHPSFGGGALTAFNLTGHPTFVAPCGFREDGTPFSISFSARLFGEERLLTVARAWQAATAWHLRHPGL